MHLRPGAWRWREPAYPKSSVRMIVDSTLAGADLYGGVIHLAPGGHIPLHWHRAGEIQFVLSGRAVLLGPGGRESRVGPNSAIFSPGGRSGAHGFRNTGRSRLSILFFYGARGGKRPALRIV